MKKLFLLSSLSFSIAFCFSLAIAKNITKSAVIGTIATLSTVSSTLILKKKSEQDIKNIEIATENLKNIRNNILTLENKKVILLELIENKTQSKIILEQEYNLIFREINNLKKELEDLKTEQENLFNVNLNVEDQKRKITLKNGHKIELKSEIKPIIRLRQKKDLYNLYNYILDGLKNSENFYQATNYETFENYLQSLQTTAEELWDSYRSSQVSVDYSSASIQAVYLMRYYPHYAYLNFQILKIIYNQNFLTSLINETLEVCLFGAGPCPEIIGLSKFLSEEYQNIENLIVNVYDIASATWTLSRDITEQFILPEYWEKDFQLNNNYLDLCQSNCFKSIKNTIKKSNIFIFQNCLNEIYDTSTVQINLNFLLNEMPLDSVIIITDLNYRQNVSIIDQLKKQVNNQFDFEIYSPSIEEIKIKPCPNFPLIIEQNLLNGTKKLIPRKNINCIFLSIRKINLKD